MLAYVPHLNVEISQIYKHNFRRFTCVKYVTSVLLSYHIIRVAKYNCTTASWVPVCNLLFAHLFQHNFVALLYSAMK